MGEPYLGIHDEYADVPKEKLWQLSQAIDNQYQRLRPKPVNILEEVAKALTKLQGIDEL